MIKENTPISMSESLEYISGKKEKDSEIKGFIKKFVKLTPKQSEQLKNKLEGLNMLKLKKSHISKIIDLIPEDKEDVHKIFTDISLTEDETKSILDSIEEFR